MDAFAVVGEFVIYLVRDNIKIVLSSAMLAIPISVSLE